MTNHRPNRVTIMEVGPRDGLQNEKAQIPTEVKVQFIEKLSETGLKQIEVTSFVHPKAIPQLADAAEVIARLPQKPDVTYWTLVPNMKGMERAIAAGVKHIAVFTAASETFTKNNINMSIAESFEAFRPVIETAKKEGITVRGYVSTAFHCPYEGKIDKEQTRNVTQRLLDLGVFEVSIGDTIGKATPEEVTDTMGYLLQTIPRDKLAMHFHDTHGRALENVRASLDLGLSTFDASAGGLGGCPYAPGASGNLATEKLVMEMNRLGIETGVDLAKLQAASQVILDSLKTPR